MLSKIIKILLFSLPFYLGASQEVFSEESVPSEDEASFLELINEARRDPLGMAESLGIDRETVLQDLPQLNAVLTEGLAPLKFDDKLYKAAFGHTEEMIANNYYSHNSLDGRTYDERIRDSGYLAVVCGESLGMVAFHNLMDPAEAVRAIFESIFLAELDPATTEDRNILNPEITEAGVVLGSGPFTFGGSILNAYLATLDFGKPVAGAEAVEQVLISMFNSARKNPRSALLNAGIDPGTAAEAYGDLAWALIWRSLAPLARDEKLHGTATAHNRDMRDRLYFDTVSPDGTTPFERVESAGYSPDRVGESLGMTLGVFEVSKVDGPIDVARCLYEILLKNDVDPRSDVQRNIFDPFMTEVGIGVETIYLDPDLGGDEDGSLYYTVVADFARPLDLRPFVMGTVYEDHNGNGALDDGEGIPGLKITLSPDNVGMGREIVTETGPTGRYQMDFSNISTDYMELYVEWDGEVLGPFAFLVGPQKINVLRDIRIDGK